jgi:hypothetical protein
MKFKIIMRVYTCISFIDYRGKIKTKKKKNQFNTFQNLKKINKKNNNNIKQQRMIA